MKRITVAIVFGLFAGVICASGAFLGGILPFTAANLVWVLLNRAVMGFAIGASALPLRWAWNGVVMGLVVGSVFSYSLYMNRGDLMIPVANALVNGLFGLMIEFFTSVVFKAPAVAVEHRTEHAVSI
jgi:hypothetical protein